MPYRSQAQAGYFHTHRAQLARQGVDVGEWDRATKGMKLPKRAKKKKKPSMMVDNHIKAYGEEDNGKIKINVRKHKGDVAELADTLKHERLHKQHEKMREKTTYEKTREAMNKMSYAEKVAYTKKLRQKASHYKQGSYKRKFKIHGKLEPGTLIEKMNESKSSKKTNSKPSTRNVGIMGLV